MVRSGEARTTGGANNGLTRRTFARHHTKEITMNRPSNLLRLAAALAVAGLAASSVPVLAEDAGAQATYRDIEQTLGSVPTFFRLFPEAGVAGAWNEFKGVQLNPGTRLDGKTKELLGLAVAAQIPCQYCVYFHTAAAKLNGATDDEIREAVAMSAIVRHWSTVLNGMQVDLAGFKRETDTVLQAASRKAAPAKAQ
jgi:AhpD family alkylhydroperoxidase